MPHFDVVVAGVGGMGSAAIYHLARRGVSVLGLERYDIPHSMGSSHGVNRIIRMAYFEDPSYVPLLRRAYELWRELEQVSGDRILVITGGLDAAPEDHRVFQGSLQSCLDHGLAHEVLTAAEVASRYPGYRLPTSHMAVFQPDGGYVMSERAVVGHVEAAQAAGAEVHGREEIVDWVPRGTGVEVFTNRDRYTADRIVFTVGAWSGGLVDDLATFAVPERQVLGWFQPVRGGLFTPQVFPIFNLEVEEGHFYGFPVETIPGFKIGLYHHQREVVDPDTMEREVSIRDEEILRAAVDRYFPDASGPVLSLKTCMFTNSPDEHFIVGIHPTIDEVVLAAGFSGHGFKFSSVIGEILADLTLDGGTGHDIDLLSPRRFFS